VLQVGTPACVAACVDILRLTNEAEARMGPGRGARVRL
jgi:hypothetical protein